MPHLPHLWGVESCIKKIFFHNIDRKKIFLYARGFLKWGSGADLSTMRVCGHFCKWGAPRLKWGISQKVVGQTLKSTEKR